MVSTGIRKLKNNLSRYLRRVKGGERILVTDRGRVVAELRPPAGAGMADGATRYRQLVEQGVVRPAQEDGDPLAGRLKLKLPRGTAAQLLDVDRGEGWTLYVETSALLAALLERDASVQRALRSSARRVTSLLTFAEANRALVRAVKNAQLSQDEQRLAVHALETFADRCDLVSVTEDVLARAGRPFPIEPIRTLDAIHLATAELLGQAPALLTILTRDGRIRDNAKALGYALA
jgi:antitoxin (DNA-binding transcriptional repressor) of toxin-antitoxin stability system/predicted nucleic acid-binding protein